MRTSPLQTAFNSGELSPLLYGRSDYQGFQTGLRTCNGFLPIRQGGVTRAPGTTWLGSTQADAPARLITFEFAINDSVIIELSDRLMRVWRYGDLVMKSGAPYTMVTPYDIEAVQRLQWVQSADVIYMVDGVLPIQRLARTALDDWSISSFEPDDGPFQSGNFDTAVTVVAATVGDPGDTVTLNAVGGIFDASMVGSLFQFEAFEYPDIPLFTTNTPIVVGEYMRAGGNIYQLVEETLGGTANDDDARTGSVVPSHTEGTVLTDNERGTKWKFISDGRAVVRIASVTNANQATGVVIRRVPLSVVGAPTYRWARAAWSPSTGYPAAIGIYDQRLVAASTPSDPRTIWFSVVGSFSEFATGADADDAFAYKVSGSDSLNRIVWLKVGSRGLHVGALGQEYSVRSDTTNEAIGPGNFELNMDAGIGSHSVMPIAPDGKVVFIAKDQSRVYQMAYAFEQDSTRPVELSLSAEHLGARRFADITWQASQQRIAWLRLEDGTLVAMLYDPQEDVLGWARYSVADGFVESCATFSDPDNARDVMMMIVRREIDGQTRRFVERQAGTYGLQTRSVIRAHHLFSAIGFNAGEGVTDTFAMPHLEGQQVYAWTEEGSLGPVTVTDGTAVFDFPVTNAIVGMLDDTHEIETLPIRAAAKDGDSTGRKMRLLPGGAIRVHQTGGGAIAAVCRSMGDTDEVSDFEPVVPDAIAGDEQILHSGVREVQVGTGYGMECSYRLRPVDAAPMTLLSVTALISEAGA